MGARSRKKTRQLDTRFKTWVYWGVRVRTAVRCWQTAMWNKQRSQEASRNKRADSRCLPNSIMERNCILHSATSRKVAGSIPDGFIGIFHWHNPSGRTMAPELIQSLTEMSIRNIFWRVKAAGAYSWQPYHLHVPVVLISGSLNLLEPSGSTQASQGVALSFRLLYLTFCRILKLWILFSPRIKEVPNYRRRSYLPKSPCLRSQDVT